jgi:hypothetical protein
MHADQPRQGAAPKVGKYDQITELPFLAAFKGDKVAIAHAVAAETKAQDLSAQLDVWPQLDLLASAIHLWNSSPERI